MVVHPGYWPFGEVSSRPEEYVEDFDSSIWVSHGHGLSQQELQALVLEYCRRRLLGIRASYSGDYVLLLSGGVDSILTAAVMKALGIDFSAVTFVSPGSECNDDTINASRVAEALGIHHVFVAPSATEFTELVTSATRRLEIADPWEVLAGVIMLAIDGYASTFSEYPLFVTAAGADVLFLGGVPDQEIGEGAVAWRDRVRSLVRQKFTRLRQIPDFHERLVSLPGNYFKVWQTSAAVQLSLQLDKDLVRGPERVDKLIFQRLALELGVPAQCLNREKSPMQVSCGGTTALVEMARTILAENSSHCAYSDPMEESLEFTVSRLLLELLRSRAQ